MSEELKSAVKELYEVFCKIKTEEECELLLSDLCTYKEIESMAQRIKAAKMLLENATYEKIIAETDISSATLSRVSRCVKYGNGYKTILNKK